MHRPMILIRRGNKFIVDQRKVLPYLKKNLDTINAAISYACQDLKYNPDKYQHMNAKEKLETLNDLVYEILKNWGVYREE